MASISSAIATRPCSTSVAATRQSSQAARKASAARPFQPACMKPGDPLVGPVARRAQSVCGFADVAASAVERVVLQADRHLSSPSEATKTRRRPPRRSPWHHALAASGLWTTPSATALHCAHGLPAAARAHRRAGRRPGLGRAGRRPRRGAAGSATSTTTCRPPGRDSRRSTPRGAGWSPGSGTSTPT